MDVFKVFPYECIQRINKKRVGEDFVLVSEPFLSNLTILSNTGTLFSGSYNLLGKQNKILKNSFLFDERKKQLKKKYPPYKTYHQHIRDLQVTRQLLEFNKPYILFQDMYIYEQYAVKNEREALLVTKRLSSCNREEKIMKAEELNVENFFGKKDGTYSICSSYGKKLDIKDHLYPNEEELLEEYKIKFMEQMSFATSNVFSKAKQSFIKNITVDDLPPCSLPNDDIFVLRHESMELKHISTTFEHKDQYKVDICSYPLQEYTKEELLQDKKLIRKRNPSFTPTLLECLGLD